MGIRPLRTQCHLACRSSGLLSRVVAQCFVAALGASLWLSSNGEGGPYLLHDSLHDPVLYIPSRLVSLFRLYYGIMTLRNFLAFSLSLIHFLLAAAFLIFFASAFLSSASLLRLRNIQPTLPPLLLSIAVDVFCLFRLLCLVLSPLSSLQGIPLSPRLFFL